jgi:hypothetical protein
LTSTPASTRPIAQQQGVDLGQAQRARVRVTGEPALDALAVLRDLVPLIAWRQQRSRLHALRDAVHLVVGQLAAAREFETPGGIRVPGNGLAIDAGLAADLSVALSRRPAAEHFFHVDHG